MSLDILRTISCATGAQAYNNLSENTTESISKSRHKMCQLPCGSTPADTCANLCCLCAIRKQCETRCSCPRRALDVFNQTTEAISFGIPNSHRRIKNLFCDLSHAVQQRTAAG